MSKQKRRPRVNRHYRIDAELTPDDLAAYRAVLVEPPTTNKSARAWLVARGYATFSESAVARHRRHHLETVAEQSRAVELARQYATLARTGEAPGGVTPSGDTPSGDDFMRGAVLRAEHLLWETLFDARDDGPVTMDDLMRYLKMVSCMVQTRRQLLDLSTAALASTDPAARRGGGPERTPDGPHDLDALTEDQRFEVTKRKAFELLGAPYVPPAQARDGAGAGPPGAPMGTPGRN
jgi:hypothetical protein